MSLLGTHDWKLSTCVSSTIVKAEGFENAQGGKANRVRGRSRKELAWRWSSARFADLMRTAPCQMMLPMLFLTPSLAVLRRISMSAQPAPVAMPRQLGSRAKTPLNVCQPNP